jgi:molybdopterin molybdotransferase
LIVTLGGASVGDHDLVQKALGPRGFALDFWKIAMRPGKPLIFGKLGGTPLLGLPGNPVSTLVCAMLFLRPAIAAMLGTNGDAPIVAARLGADLKENDSRQDYLRAHVETRSGERIATPFPIQDSSMLSVLARADGLVIRAPRAPAAKVGDFVSVLLLD